MVWFFKKKPVNQPHIPDTNADTPQNLYNAGIHLLQSDNRDRIRELLNKAVKQLVRKAPDHLSRIDLIRVYSSNNEGSAKSCAISYCGKKGMGVVLAEYFANDGKVLFHLMWTVTEDSVQLKAEMWNDMPIRYYAIAEVLADDYNRTINDIKTANFVARESLKPEEVLKEASNVIRPPAWQ